MRDGARRGRRDGNGRPGIPRTRIQGPPRARQARAARVGGREGEGLRSGVGLSAHDVGGGRGRGGVGDWRRHGEGDLLVRRLGVPAVVERPELHRVCLRIHARDRTRDDDRSTGLERTAVDLVVSRLHAPSTRGHVVRRRRIVGRQVDDGNTVVYRDGIGRCCRRCPVVDVRMAVGAGPAVLVTIPAALTRVVRLHPVPLVVVALIGMEGCGVASGLFARLVPRTHRVYRRGVAQTAVVAMDGREITCAVTGFARHRTCVISSRMQIARVAIRTHERRRPACGVARGATRRLVRCHHVHVMAAVGHARTARDVRLHGMRSIDVATARGAIRCGSDLGPVAQLTAGRRPARSRRRRFAVKRRETLVRMTSGSRAR